MSDDTLGTNCDQCRSMVQCCFTSTETLGRKAQDGHLDLRTAPELWEKNDDNNNSFIGLYPVKKKYELTTLYSITIQTIRRNSQKWFTANKP